MTVTTHTTISERRPISFSVIDAAPSVFQLSQPHELIDQHYIHLTVHRGGDRQRLVYFPATYRDARTHPLAFLAQALHLAGHELLREPANHDACPFGGTTTGGRSACGATI